MEKSLTQSGELAYEVLLRDLKKVGCASRVYLLLDGKSKEPSEDGLRASHKDRGNLCEEWGHLIYDYNATPSEKSPQLMEVKAIQTAIIEKELKALKKLVVMLVK